MKEEKYIEKAIALFKQEGIAMPIDTIADYIGVTKKTLYNNFESKDGLIEKCMLKILDDLRAALACLTDESKDVRECFTEGITVLVDFFRETSPKFLSGIARYYPQIATNDHDAGRELFNEKLQQNILRGQEEGVYRNEIDAALIAGYISYSIFSYFKKSVMHDGDFAAQHYFKQVIDFNLKALIK